MTPVLLLLTALPAAPTLPEYDAFGESNAVARAAFYSPAARARIEAGWISHTEPRLGVPTFFWAPRPPEEANTLRELGLTPEQAARRWLFVYGELYRQNVAALAAQPVQEIHDLGDGAIIVRFRKQSHGVPVFRDTLNVVMTRGLQLVALSGYLSPHEANADFPLAAPTALALARQDATGQWVPPADIRSLQQFNGGWERFTGNARAKKVLFPLPDRLEPAWQLEITVVREDGTDDAYSYVVSARDGRLLLRHDLTQYAGYRVWADSTAPFVPWDGPHGPTASTPNASGLLDGFQAPPVASQLVTVNSVPPVTDPWLPAAATTLFGNNIEAYADLVGPDGFNPDGGEDGGVDLGIPASSAGVFDHAANFAQNADFSPLQRYAGGTSAFFLTNWAHDVLYAQGFDEKAGNGQRSNFARGGLEGDPVRVEVHDYFTRNIASMRVPADGEPGRLQSFLFDSVGPSLFASSSDGGSLDAGLQGAGPSLFGPQAFDLTAPVVRGYDGIDAGHDGCDGPLVNAGEVNGNIVLFDTPRCAYANAIFVAADAGAVGVLITHSNQGLIEIGGPPGASGPPALLLQRDAGIQLAFRLDAGEQTLVRMYRPARVDRDSALDNSVLAHEYAHFLSLRLVGDANGLLNQSARSLGEGWSDFFALWMMAREDDGLVPSNAMWRGTFAIGSHVRAGTGFDGVGNPAYYLGVRRYPYSVDFAKNGLTFKHVQLGQALPLVPGAPTGDNTEVHNAGEVWASMLWEGYVPMLTTARYPYAVARERMLQYLIGSLKATPMLPTYLEARDAFLAVVAAKDPLDLIAWTQAFGRRGIGFKATGPARFALDNKPVVEDTGTTGNFVRVTSVTVEDAPGYCDKDGVLDVNENGVVRISLLNAGAGSLSSTMALVTTASPGITFGNGGVATFSAMGSFARGTATVPIRLTAATGPLTVPLTVIVTDPALMANVTFNTSVLLNVDAVPSALEKAESNVDVWTSEIDSLEPHGYEELFLARDTATPGQKEFTGPNVAYRAESLLTTPSLDVGTGALTMTFKHRFSFENTLMRSYDGARLETSTDDGATWVAVPAAAVTPAYNGTIYAQSQATLRGQAAFVNQSPGYPAMVTQTVDFGTQHAGKKLKVRFHLSTDPTGGAPGWAIDDVSFTGLTNKPFFENVGDRAMCVNRPPVIAPIPDQTVPERTTVDLKPNVTDADGQTPVLSWTQTAGPTVAVTGNTFSAPEVTADTVLTFTLTATDGTLMATAVAKVTVRNANRAPVARAPDGKTVKAGDLVSLEATAVDPDGDALTFAWTQTGESTAEVMGEKTATLTFTAPGVATNTTFTFQVVASDGLDTSGPAAVEVLVTPAGGGGCGCTEGGATTPLALGLLLLGLAIRASQRRWAASASHALRR